MEIQRQLAVAADAHDRTALERGIADGFRAAYRIVENGRPRSGETTKARVIARWTAAARGALPTLVTHQRAVVVGSAATAFACFVDRSRGKNGREDPIYTEVADSFSRVAGRWLWIASMENQVPRC
jgi:hypothetical protein